MHRTTNTRQSVTPSTQWNMASCEASTALCQGTLPGATTQLAGFCICRKQPGIQWRGLCACAESGQHDPERILHIARAGCIPLEMFQRLKIVVGPPYLWPIGITWKPILTKHPGTSPDGITRNRAYAQQASPALAEVTSMRPARGPAAFLAGVTLFLAAVKRLVSSP